MREVGLPSYFESNKLPRFNMVNWDNLKGDFEEDITFLKEVIFEKYADRFNEKTREWLSKVAEAPTIEGDARFLYNAMFDRLTLAMCLKEHIEFVILSDNLCGDEPMEDSTAMVMTAQGLIDLMLIIKNRARMLAFPFYKED